MKAIARFIGRLFGAKKYMYYVVIVKEAFRANGADNHDTYISGYLFRSRKEAEEYASWLVSSTVLYDSAVVEQMPSDHRMMCAHIRYPKHSDDKLEPVFVEPVPFL